MIDWAEVVLSNGSRIGFYANEYRAAMPMGAFDRLLSASPIQTVLSAPHIPFIGVNAVPNVTLNIVNTDGACARAFADFSPIDLLLNCYDAADDLVFSGVIDTATFGNTAILTAVSFRVDEPVQLRTTAEWGEYVNQQPIPEVFGDCSRKHLKTIPYDSDGYEHCFSNGVAAGTACRIDGQVVDNVAFDTIRDKANQPISIVRLGAALADGSTVTVSAIGQRDPTSGALIDNPADLIAYLIARFARQAIPAQHVDALRHRCNQLGIRVAYQLTESITIAELINSLASGVGLGWTYGQFALLPELTPQAAVEAIEDEEVIGEESFVGHRPTTELKLNYLYHPALDDYQRHITLRSANYSAATAASLELFSPWLVDDYSAFEYGSRLLTWLSRYAYRGQLTVKTARRIGTWYTVSHPRLPIAPAPSLVFGTVPLAAGYALSLLHVSPRTHAIRLVLEATRADTPQVGGIEQTEADGRLVLKIIGDDLQPAPGALVTLDNGATHRADESGIVIFTDVPAGLHTVVYLIDGFEAREITIRTGGI